MSFLTCFWLFPQKEHLSRSPPSPMRAMSAAPVPSGAPSSGRTHVVMTVPAGARRCEDRGDLSGSGRQTVVVRSPRDVRGRKGAPGTALRRARPTAGGGRADARSASSAQHGCSLRKLRSADRGQLPALDDLVDDPVLLGLLGREDPVPLDVVVHLLGRAPAVRARALA